MILEICAVFDLASGAFSRPVFVPSIGVMMRSFTDEVNRRDENNPMFDHSEDFRLFHLGQFNDETAEFDLLSQPKLLVAATDVSLKRKGNGNGVSQQER